MKKIKITKLEAVEDPFFETPSKEDYIEGIDNGNVSLFNGYTVTGILCGDIEEGSSIILARDSRNGVSSPGIFSTSAVNSFDGKIATTSNSVYEIEYLED